MSFILCHIPPLAIYRKGYMIYILLLLEIGYVERGTIVYIRLDKGGQEGVYELYTPKGIYGSPQLRGGYEKSPEALAEGDFSYPSPKLRGPINARGHI